MGNVVTLPRPPAEIEPAASLPALIARAGQRLLDARTSGEVLEAKKMAEARLHYAKVTGAANESHADILRIITRAEIIMANAIDRGQEAGEVARAGGDRQSIVQAPDNGEATFSDLGVSRQRVSEWRDVRDAGEQVVEGALERALAAGRAPTKSEVLKAARTAKRSPDDEMEAADAAAGPGASDRTMRRAEKDACRFWRFFTEATSACEGLGRTSFLPEPMTRTEWERASKMAAAAQRGLRAFAKRLRAVEVVGDEPAAPAEPTATTT